MGGEPTLHSRFFDIDRIFGYHLGRPTLPEAFDTFEDQLSAFCPLCGHFGFQWPTRKARRSETRRLAYAAAAQQAKTGLEEGIRPRR